MATVQETRELRHLTSRSMSISELPPDARDVTKPGVMSARTKPMILTESMGNAPYLWNPIFNRGIVDHSKAILTRDDTSTTYERQSAYKMDPFRGMLTVACPSKSHSKRILCTGYKLPTVQLRSLTETYLCFCAGTAFSEQERRDRQ